MSYVVLARKWRPRVFEDLTGQDHVARTLRNAIEANRVPHAMLFTGARGVGKTSSARILAMALNCRTNGTSPEPCGECDACQEIQTGRSIDVLEIDGASNRGINEIRELRESVMFAPQRDPYKVYIIDEVHMLTQEAFNALLKTLEEPPPHVIFVFATTEPQKIPVTILSRCQRFDFRRISQRDIIKRLSYISEQESLEVDDEALALIARQAQGGMRDALSLLDQLISFSSGAIDASVAAQLLGAADKGSLFELSDAILRSNVGDALTVLDRVREFGTDAAWFATELVTHLRDLAVLAASDASSHEQLTSLVESERQLALQQIERTNAHTLHRYFQLAMDEAEAIHRSSFSDFRLELALINLCRASEINSIDEIVSMLKSQSGSRSPGTQSSRNDTAGSVEDDEERAVANDAIRAADAPSPQGPKSTTHAPPTPSKAATARSTSAKPTVSTIDESVSPKASKPARSKSKPSNAKSVPGEPREDGPANASTKEGETATFEASASAEARALTLAEWRQLNRHASDVSLGLSGLFQSAYLLPESEGSTMVAISTAALERVTAETRIEFDKLAAELLGVNPKLTLVSHESVDDEILKGADRIADIEVEEEKERLRNIRERLRTHQTTERILSRWPDSQVSVDVHKLPEEERI